MLRNAALLKGEDPAAEDDQQSDLLDTKERMDENDQDALEKRQQEREVDQANADKEREEWQRDQDDEFEKQNEEANDRLLRDLKDKTNNVLKQQLIDSKETG